MPEPFFIHDGEIVIRIQEQNMYCQFRIAEGDIKECARLQIRDFELLDQNRLKWESIIMIEFDTLVCDKADNFLRKSFP